MLGVWKNAGRSFCHLSTGFIGTKTLMLALAKIGRNPDTGFGAGAAAYRLIHNDTFPSWGFSIKHGATSIWERWNGWTPETGSGNPGMNSFAHYSFGAVYQWMVENIGSIRNDAHSSPHAPREVHSSHGNGHHAERDDYYGRRPRGAGGGDGEVSVRNSGEIVAAFRAENDSHSRPWNHGAFALASVLARTIMPRKPPMSTTKFTVFHLDNFNLATSQE